MMAKQVLRSFYMLSLSERLRGRRQFRHVVHFSKTAHRMSDAWAVIKGGEVWRVFDFWCLLFFSSSFNP